MSRSNDRVLLLVAALSGATAVAAGAFAAHGAGPQIKTLLQTGAQYQLIHAVLAVAALSVARSRLAAWLALAGGLVFALALYALAFTGSPAFGLAAPIGGVLMILGWLALALAAVRRRDDIV